MRILEVVADGNPGGGTTHVVQILEGLRRDHSLGLVTQKDSYLSSHAETLDIPVFGVDFFRSRLDPRAPFRLCRVFREFDPQLVHLHGGRAAFFAALASPEMPTIYSVHGYHFLHKSPIMRRLALNAERLAARRAQEIIFESRYDARVAENHGIVSRTGRETIIPNTVPLPEVSEAHADPRHVGFVGRLERQKDPSLFLDVMERLPEYSATMIGGGALEGEVEAEIRRRGLSNIRMLGALPHAEHLKALPEFGVVVMTSRWEGLPILPLEAMWLGVPVVAANVGALDEVIEHEKNGLLVDSRSPEDFARAVERLAEDAALCERIVENARDRIRSQFSEERMLADIRDLYRRVAGG
ncbi:MAG: glycosyltransferase [Actinobacteria bacterium]|nr:glycosyltransferase [Actinomycetota bacterium]